MPQPETPLRHLQAVVRDIAPDGADYDVEVVCSTDSVDRAGEIIDQDGWRLDAFRTNPVFLAAHQHRLADGRSPVIGSFVAGSPAVADRDGGGRELVGRVKFADTELGREYRSLYRDRHMRAVSVGFAPLKHETRSIDGRKTLVYTTSELHEVSAVAVGMNAEALARLRELGLAPADDGGPGITGGVAEAVVQAALDCLAGSIERLEAAVAALTDTQQRLEAHTDETLALAHDGAGSPDGPRPAADHGTEPDAAPGASAGHRELRSALAALGGP